MLWVGFVGVRGVVGRRLSLNSIVDGTLIELVGALTLRYPLDLVWLAINGFMLGI